MRSAAVDDASSAVSERSINAETIDPPARLHTRMAAVAMIALILIHAYAAIWVKGTIRAMWYGTVTRAWARQHHRAWYREVTGK